MYWDRFDICEAYWLFFVNYHEGQSSLKYKRLCRLLRSFKPSPFCGTYAHLTENGKEIYKNLVRKEVQNERRKRNNQA